MPNKALDTNAPIVTVAAAGEALSTTLYGTAISYTAPSPFAATATFTTGGKSVHVVPKVAASTMPTAFLTQTLLEDAKTQISLLGDSAVGKPLVPRITTLPTKGSLYQARESTPHTPVRAHRGTRAPSLPPFPTHRPSIAHPHRPHPHHSSARHRSRPRCPCCPPQPLSPPPLHTPRATGEHVVRHVDSQPGHAQRAA